MAAEAQLTRSCSTPIGLGEGRHMAYLRDAGVKVGPKNMQIDSTSKVLSFAEATRRGVPSTSHGRGGGEVRPSLADPVDDEEQVGGRILVEDHIASYMNTIRKEQPVCIDVDSLPSPIVEGGIPTVTLPREAIDRGMEFYQFSLIGRFNFRKISILRARKIATLLWAPTGDWKFIPLGNGFVMVKLNSRDEFVKIWAQSWNFDNQVVRFTRWTNEFHPDKQCSSKALLWVKFPKLPQQFWDYEILMMLGKGLGTPIGFDRRTIQREYGFFANVLVDVDMSKPVPSSINIKEEGGKQFTQVVEIPKLPNYCNHCRVVGHDIKECRNLMKAFEISTQIGDSGRGTQAGRRTQQEQSSKEADTIVGKERVQCTKPQIPSEKENTNNSLQTNAIDLGKDNGNALDNQFDPPMGLLEESGTSGPDKGVSTSNRFSVLESLGEDTQELYNEQPDYRPLYGIRKDIEEAAPENASEKSQCARKPVETSQIQLSVGPVRTNEALNFDEEDMVLVPETQPAQCSVVKLAASPVLGIKLSNVIGSNIPILKASQSKSKDITEPCGISVVGFATTGPMGDGNMDRVQFSKRNPATGPSILLEDYSPSMRKGIEELELVMGRLAARTCGQNDQASTGPNLRSGTRRRGRGIGVKIKK